MATATYQRAAHNDRRWRRRQPSDSSERSGLAIVLVLIGGLIAGIIFSASLIQQPLSTSQINLLSMLTSQKQPERVQSGYPTAAAKPAPAAEAAPPRVEAQPTVAPTVAPTATAATGDQATVARTDGVGVVLRATPNDKDWTTRGFMDGASVTVLERQGDDWVRVRGANGNEGWVPAKYLDS